MGADIPNFGALSVAFSRDDQLLAVGHSGRVTSLTLWKWREGELWADLEGHSKRVVALAFSPDGKLLLSGAHDSTARVWEVASGKELGWLRFPGENTYVESVGFSPDGKLLFAAADGQIKIAESPVR